VTRHRSLVPNQIRGNWSKPAHCYASKPHHCATSTAPPTCSWLASYKAAIRRNDVWFRIVLVVVEHYVYFIARHLMGPPPLCLLVPCMSLLISLSHSVSLSLSLSLALAVFHVYCTTTTTTLQMVSCKYFDSLPLAICALFVATLPSFSTHHDLSYSHDCLETHRCASRRTNRHCIMAATRQHVLLPS
jgi:hypothetical protein